MGDQTRRNVGTEPRDRPWLLGLTHTTGWLGPASSPPHSHKLSLSSRTRHPIIYFLDYFPAKLQVILRCYPNMHGFLTYFLFKPWNSFSQEKIPWSIKCETEPRSAALGDSKTGVPEPWGQSIFYVLSSDSKVVVEGTKTAGSLHQSPWDLRLTFVSSSKALAMRLDLRSWGWWVIFFFTWNTPLEKNPNL